MKYWIFQCSPDAIDKDVEIETAIKNKHPFFQEWGVRQHKDEIGKGDKAIIWVTGKNARLVALADVTDNQRLKTDNSLFATKSNTGERLKNQNDKVVPILTYLLPKSISKDKIKNTKGLEKFGAGRRATNIPLDSLEYDIIMTLI